MWLARPTQIFRREKILKLKIFNFFNNDIFGKCSVRGKCSWVEMGLIENLRKKRRIENFPKISLLKLKVAENFQPLKFFYVNYAQWGTVQHQTKVFYFVVQSRTVCTTYERYNYKTDVIPNKVCMNILVYTQSIFKKLYRPYFYFLKQTVSSIYIRAHLAVWNNSSFIFAELIISPGY
jgi:hypothetical protein